MRKMICREVVTEPDKGKQDATALPSVQEAAVFLAEYASWMLGCGATCIRIEKNVDRMAAAFDMEDDISIMPSHVQVSVWKGSVTYARMVVRKARLCGISFDLNARLSRLSWEVADRKVDYSAALKQFEDIIRIHPTGKWEVLVLASLANAAFCRLFGGDGVAMLLVFLSTLAGYRLKQLMLEDGRNVRLTFLCASFFSAAISAGGHVFDWGTTPEIALGTSVLYLIPGVPYINAVSDMMDRHYLCSFSRFMDAALLTACLSAGLCAGMLILGLRWL
ncbi:MAG: threonine/serine exporter ThrE family protein [Prevotella sp.]